ncbi:MAG: COX15/CtaA family protein [Acidimicrobiales bacterium]
MAWLRSLGSVTVGPAAYRRITLVALVLLVAIIVTGAAVRLTDSGLGCTDWPTCDGTTIVPRAEYHQLIEGVNRLFTGLVSAAIALAVLGSLRRTPRRADLTVLALGLVAGVIGQIVLGGLTVLFHLWPPLVMGHLVLSLTLVTCAMVLHQRAAWPETAAADREGWAMPARRHPAVGGDVRVLSRWLLVAGAVLVLTGTMVTGAGPHGGDPEADRLPLDMLQIVRVHGIAMVVFLGGVVVALGRLARTRAPAAVRRAGATLVTVLVAQAGVGYLQYFTNVPPLLVGIHVFGATLVWMALINFQLQLATPAAVAAPVTAGATSHAPVAVASR